MRLRSSGPRARLVMAVSGALVVGGGIATVATLSATAATTAPTGTTLCVSKGFGVVLTPTATGRCLGGQTPVDVANLDGVSALSAAVNSLESVAPLLFHSHPGAGGGGTTSTYTVPAGVTELRVELWGGGGGGGGGDNMDGGSFFSGGGGGAQGDYTHSVIQVVPGDTCTVVVGSGGAGGFGGGTINTHGSVGVDGGPSSFTCTQSPASLSAPGGLTAGSDVAPFPANEGGVDPVAPLTAAFQTYPGQPGQDGGFEPSTPGSGGGGGGGGGFPGSGGSGGGVDHGSGDGGHGGAAGLALITPVSGG